jgi:hypothetical protein
MGEHGLPPGVCSPGALPSPPQQEYFFCGTTHRLTLQAIKVSARASDMAAGRCGGATHRVAQHPFISIHLGLVRREPKKAYRGAVLFCVCGWEPLDLQGCEASALRSMSPRN